MKVAPHLLLLVPVIGLSACSTSGTPLIFGEVVNFGVTASAAPDGQGVDFTLGYKDKNLAVVPVAVITDGKVSKIRSRDKRSAQRDDALSVFGQFTSQGNWPMLDPNKQKQGSIKLDRFFATGLAATRLADGYKAGMQGVPCPIATGKPQACGETSSAETVAASNKPRPSDAASAADKPDEPKPVEPAGDAPDRKVIRMYFGQTNTIGIGISVPTGVAEQGPNFTLGYSGRSIAYIPTLVSGKNGKSVHIDSGDRPKDGDGDTPKDAGEFDALSVLGQFKAQTGTNTINYGLGRFFTTGMAARNLAEGFESLLSREVAAESLREAEKAKAGGTEGTPAADKPQ